MRRAALLALPAVALWGCTTKVDAKDAEKKISQALEKQTKGQKVTVDCPGGKPRKKGTTFICKAKAADGSKGNFRVTLTDDDGHFKLQQVR